MDGKTKKILNQGLKSLLIRIGVVAIGFWLLANLWNVLNGNQFLSLEKSLFVSAVIFLVLIVLVIAYGMFAPIIQAALEGYKEKFKDKG